MALQHSLDKYYRILESYTVLFEQARQVLGFTFRDLSFENFSGMIVPPQPWVSDPPIRTRQSAEDAICQTFHTQVGPIPVAHLVKSIKYEFIIL